MTDIIKIGSADVGMSATASSPIRYRSIFSRDFFRETTKPDPDPYLYVEMGYVMHMAYEGEMASASYEGFVEWLDSFAPMDMIDAVPAIVELWQASEKRTSAAKKKNG